MSREVSNTKILVLSCRKFEQAWQPFFVLFAKYWPDCPYEIVLGTDTGTYSGIQTIQTGTDAGWASNARYILKKLEAERVILLLEDYLLFRSANNGQIISLNEHAYEYNIGCLRLVPCPGPTAGWAHSGKLGTIQPADRYRVSLQTAIWKKDLLLAILKDGETAWETEINGTIRSARINDSFVSVLRGDAPIDYLIAIRKNVWQPEALNFLQTQGFDVAKIRKVIK